MIDVKDISIEKIKNGDFKDDIPEFYELKNVFENNLWHYETTFDHTLMVLEEYEKFVQNNKIGYLDEKIGHYSKRELFQIAILLHDISKKETIVIAEDQTTSFPNHEEEGGKKAKNILDNFDISQAEKKFIVSVISNHGKPHIILGDRDNCDSKLNELKNEISEIYRETLILAMVDTMGSKLKQNDQEEYNFRINKYRSILGIG